MIDYLRNLKNIDRRRRDQRHQISFKGRSLLESQSKIVVRGFITWA
jgi:hypothetical protein